MAKPSTNPQLRAASIGYSFYEPRVKDISYRSNETLLGYDIVLLYLDNLVTLYTRSYGDWYKGRPSLGDHDSARILEDVTRRKRELTSFLELGGTMVLFLPAPDSWYVDSGRREYSGTGRNRQTTRIVNEMQLLSVLPVRIQTQAAETRDLALKAAEPFSTFWRSRGHRFQAAAVLTEPFGETTLVIKGTETIAGSIASIGKGLVILLPQDLLYPVEQDDDQGDDEEGDDEEADDEEEVQPYEGDVELLDSLFDLIRSLRAASGEFEQPKWARDYLLPSEDELVQKVHDVGTRVARET